MQIYSYHGGDEVRQHLEVYIRASYLGFFSPLAGFELPTEIDILKFLV